MWGLGALENKEKQKYNQTLLEKHIFFTKFSMDHGDVTYCSICSSDNTGPYEASDFLENLQSLLGTDLLPCPPVSPRMYHSQKWQDMEQMH